MGAATLVVVARAAWRRDGRRTGRVSVKQAVAQSSVACLEVVGIEGKGKGAVAKRDVKPGELIVSEAPLLSFRHNSPMSVVVEQCGMLADDATVAFMDLHDAYVKPGEPKTAEGVLKTNAAEVLMSDNTPLRVLCQTISRFNHSCNPNCEAVWSEEIGQNQVYACIEIKAGEELSLSYIEHRAPREERQEELLEDYKFQCRCSACESADPDCDERRMRMLELHPELGDPDYFAEPEEKVGMFQLRVFSFQVQLLLSRDGWLLLAAPRSSWLLLAAPGCSWLLLEVYLMLLRLIVLRQTRLHLGRKVVVAFA